MPKISIISIASQKEEFASMKNALSKQTLQDFEMIEVIGNPDAKSWNRGIKCSNGEILVFIEASAQPVNERWLEELVGGLTDEHTVVKGLEVTTSPLDPSSLAGYCQALVDQPFNESYLWSEDTELFCRLKEAGYRFVQLDCAPIIHLQKLGSKTFMRRAFRYGLYWSRLRHRYADPVELLTVSAAWKRMIGAMLNLLGMRAGAIVYRGERRTS